MPRIAAQGSEDFAGVDMLYRNPSARRLAFGLLQTFIYPWASPVLGWTIFALAAIGTLALLRRAPRVVLLLAGLALPYLFVHLLLQETVTTRYALPLIPVMAYLAVKGISSVALALESAVAGLKPGAATSAAVAVLVVWSLVQTLPAVRVYAREGSPAFAAMRELHRRLDAEPHAAIGMHQGFARSMQTQNFGNVRVLSAPPMREWLELAEYWREGNTAPVWFLADPARTDIELIDPLSRKVQAHYIWAFPEGALHQRRAPGHRRSGAHRLAPRMVCRRRLASDVGNAEHVRASRPQRRRGVHQEPCRMRRCWSSAAKAPARPRACR